MGFQWVQRHEFCDSWVGIENSLEIRSSLLSSAQRTDISYLSTPTAAQAP